MNCSSKVPHRADVLWNPTFVSIWCAYIMCALDFWLYSQCQRLAVINRDE